MSYIQKTWPHIGPLWVEEFFTRKILLLVVSKKCYSFHHVIWNKTKDFFLQQKYFIKNYIKRCGRIMWNDPIIIVSVGAEIMADS